MAKELVTNIYTDGTDWEHTIIAAHHNFLICNILVASVHTHTVKNVPRGKGKSANPNSHHVPHLLPDQKHKPTAAKLHYAVLITALEIFFQAGKFPRNNCLSRAGGTSQWWANGASQVQQSLSMTVPVLTALSSWGLSTKLEGFIRHLDWWGAISTGCVSISFNWSSPVWDSISGNHKGFGSQSR